MSDPGIGHNLGPDLLTPPTVENIGLDLAKRYPDVAKRLKELEGAAKKVPKELKTEDDATATQDLLRQLAVAKKQWGAARGVEKEPWQTVADAVFGFFKKPEDTVAGLINDIKPRHTEWLAAKAAREKAERERKANEERERARLAEEEARAAEARARKAEQDEREAREREAEAIRREDEAREDRMWAEARAELAKWEERKALERKAEREEQDRRERTADKKLLTVLTREANALSKKDDDDTLTEDERARYKALIGRNGEIRMLQIRLERAEEGILTREQRNELRAEEANLNRLQAEREKNQRKAEEAARRARAAVSVQSDARAEVREARSEVREATRDANLFDQQAERSDSRADRIERRLNSATDADLSRTRSNVTVGSLTGRWEFEVLDRDAIPLERLRGYLHPDAIDAAITLYARDNRTEQGIPPLEGVKFHWVKDSRIT